MSRNFNPEFVRSKSCRDCTQRIWYDLQARQWCDSSDLKVRHNCSKWQPSRPITNEEQLDHISRNQIEILSEISKVKKVLWETSQDVKKLLSQHVDIQGDHE